MCRRGASPAFPIGRLVKKFTSAGVVVWGRILCECFHKTGVVVWGRLLRPIDRPGGAWYNEVSLEGEAACMRYTAINIESGETVTFCTYEGHSLHQALEEALYIMWELEPADRDWFRQLACECCCEFRYGTSERFIVSYDWDGTTIEVRPYQTFEN